MKLAISALAILLLPSAANAEGASAMKSFGLVGAWAENCADPGSMHLTFTHPYFGDSTIAMATQNPRDGNGTLHFDVASASLLTVEKLRVMAWMTGKDDLKIPKEKAREITPSPAIFERAGNKIKMEDQRLLEQCLSK
jgi:hypothetical protein